MLNVNNDSKPTGFLREILHLLETYNLMSCVHYGTEYQFSPHTENRNKIFNSRVFKHKGHAFLLPPRKCLLLSLP